MALASFYHPSLNQQDTVVELEANEAAHALKVRRLKNGQQVRLFNGAGLVALGVLQELNRRSASVELSHFDVVEERNTKLGIAVAIPKGDRQKMMVDMLTQLGVHEIIPIECDYSVTKFNDKLLSKWQKVSIEAAKQSQNAYLPIIQNSMTLSDLLSDTGLSIYVANADGERWQKSIELSRNALVLVGPEGGFSDQELDLFRLNKLNFIALGGHILRTETAAIAVASQFNALTQTSK